MRQLPRIWVETLTIIASSAPLPGCGNGSGCLTLCATPAYRILEEDCDLPIHLQVVREASGRVPKCGGLVTQVQEPADHLWTAPRPSTIRREIGQKAPLGIGLFEGVIASRAA